MTEQQCKYAMHCPTPWSHSDLGALVGASYGLGGYNQSAIAQQGYVYTNGNQISQVIIRQLAAEPKKPRRCLERLREEIVEWHGSILKS